MEPVADLTKGRPRRVWIWLAAALVLLGVSAAAWWGMSRGRRAEARRRVDEAWARFERCLIGPPLAAGESARVRVRRIWLATPPPKEGIPAKQAEQLWPARCARYLDGASADVSDAEMDQAVADLFIKAGVEAKTSGEPGRWSSFDDIFAGVAKGGVRLGADARVPLPAEPARPFRRAELTPLGSGAVATWARREPPGAWRFLLDGKSLCEVDLAAATGGCAPLAFAPGSDAKVDLAPGDPDAPPVIIVRKQGGEGVYEVLPAGANGERGVERLHAGLVRNAYGRGHGAADLLLGAEDPGFTLVRVRGGKASARIPLPIPRGSAVDGAELIDDSIVWTTTGKGGKGGHLLRLPLPPSGALPAVEDLGELPAGGAGNLRGCRRDDTRAILVSGGAGQQIVVRGNNTWGEPAKIELPGFPVLSCRGAGVILTSQTLRRVRCTNAECMADGVTLDLPDQAVGADVGERGVVAHGQVLHGGRPGGVRLRVGLLEGLHGAAVRVLLDDADEPWHEGVDPTALYLFGGQDFGLLLVPDAGDHAMYGFRIAPDGGVTPIGRK